jgi:hypothetical protein
VAGTSVLINTPLQWGVWWRNGGGGTVLTVSDPPNVISIFYAESVEEAGGYHNGGKTGSLVAPERTHPTEVAC